MRLCSALASRLPRRFGLALAAFAATAAVAQPPPPGGAALPSLNAVSVDGGAVTLDGRLDEAAWAGAPAATGFVQRGPTPGAPASQSTEARVVYDGTAVYVGMRMHDTDAAAIQAPLGRRDAGLSSDQAFVAFDSFHDRRTAYLFGVNPAGVQMDLLLYDDGQSEDDSWDAVWDVATTRDSAGWTAEFRIPLSQLRYGPAPGEQEWGVEFGRDIQRTGEETFWAPLLPGVDGTVSRFGTLGGLRGLGAPRRLEVVPYVAAQAVRAPDTRAPSGPADPYYASTDAEPRVGLDLKYGLSSNLTLTATVNPDFGQVEADPAQVNLGGFELFLQERRPFFVEGADIFSFGRARSFMSSNRPQLLYTRRIGRSPQRQGFVPGDVDGMAGEQGVVYTDAPQQTTILGAAKVSGRVGAVSLGVLNAVTAREYGRYSAFDGTGNPVTDGRSLVEPLSNYSVVRARATLGRTLVGAAGTLVLRDLSDPAFPSLMPSQASVLALDVEHRLRGAGQWILSGVLAGSHVSGSSEAITGVQRAFPRLYQRPDAGHVSLDTTRTSLQGLTGEFALQKANGEHWFGSVSTAFTTPGFDSNSLGYQSRADDAYVGGVLVYAQNEPRAWYRSFELVGFAQSGWNFDGDRTRTFLGGNAAVDFANFWNGRVEGSVGARTVDDRITRGGPVALNPAGVDLNATVNTDDRRPVSGYLQVYGGANEVGYHSVGTETGVSVRPASNVSVGLYPGVNVSHVTRQYVTAFDAPEAVATGGRRYVFAESEQAEFSMSTRIDWTFTSRLSLQLFARPFVSRGRYDVFKEVTAPRQLNFPTVEETGGTVVRNDDGSVLITPGDGGAAYRLQPDFTVRALQGNAVLRWEYRPGSALFVVWQ
ncbi:MAG TPA: DUF5916 domain-containing protein, partial [Rubricoccaceae bacterium]